MNNESTALRKSFLLTLFLIIVSVHHYHAERTLTKTSPENGAKLDVQTSNNISPSVHMLKEGMPLSLDPRMAQGPTTIVTPDQTYSSPLPISSNIQQPQSFQNTQAPIQGSRNLGLSLSSPGNQPNTSGNPAYLKTDFFSTTNPNTQYPGRQLNINKAPVNLYDPSKPMNLTPNIVYSQKRNHSKKLRKSKKPRGRRLRRSGIGSVSFPYDPTRMRSLTPNLPFILNVEKTNNPVPDLEKKLQIIREDDNSNFTTEYAKTTFDSIGLTSLDNFKSTSLEFEKAFGYIGKIRDLMSEIKLYVNERTDTVSTNLEKVIQDTNLADRNLI